MVSENTMNLIKYLQEHDGEDLTSADVAEALGCDKRKIDGSFTGGLSRKELGYREDAEIEDEQGMHTKVKLLRLTDKGRAWTPESETENKDK